MYNLGNQYQERENNIWKQKNIHDGVAHVKSVHVFLVKTLQTTLKMFYALQNLGQFRVRNYNHQLRTGAT